MISDGLNRHGMGCTIACPICRQAITIWFRNPFDLGTAFPTIAPDVLVGRCGLGLDDLTLSKPMTGLCGHTVDITQGIVSYVT
jgi:hypothetical protein